MYHKTLQASTILLTHRTKPDVITTKRATMGRFPPAIPSPILSLIHRGEEGLQTIRLLHTLICNI